MNNTELLDVVKCIHEVLKDVSTGKRYEDAEIISKHRESRRILMQDESVSKMLPDFIKNYRDLPSFWGFIREEVGSYAARRKYLSEAFAPLYDFLEFGKNNTPVDGIMENATDITSLYVREIWGKAITRRETDPEGAITLARTLLEATCKYILDSLNVEYDDKSELPDLYRLTARQLKLAPSQHTEQQFKQILGGAESVINGLASLRNKLSDAHAISKVRVRPSARHAALCVNMSGTMAEFLIATYEQRGNNHSQLND